MPVLSESDVTFSVLQCSFTVFFFLVICPLPEKALSHAVTVSGFQKSVGEFVETSVKAWTSGSFPPLSPSASLSSAFLNTQTFFFFSIIVASVECVAVLSSGGFRRVWTNDLSSFVMCLKRMGYKCLLQRGTVHVECSFLKYLFLWWYVILYKKMLVAYKQIEILFLNYLYLLSM